LTKYFSNISHSIWKAFNSGFDIKSDSQLFKFIPVSERYHNPERGPCTKELGSKNVY
jgi:hypothetical protein